MKTLDIKFNEMCEEIDYWKAEALHWKREAKYYQKEYSKSITDGINNNYNMVGLMLKSIIEPSKTT